MGIPNIRPANGVQQNNQLIPPQQNLIPIDIPNDIQNMPEERFRIGVIQTLGAVVQHLGQTERDLTNAQDQIGNLQQQNNELRNRVNILNTDGIQTRNQLGQTQERLDNTQAQLNTTRQTLNETQQKIADNQKRNNDIAELTLRAKNESWLSNWKKEAIPTAQEMLDYMLANPQIFSIENALVDLLRQKMIKAGFGNNEAPFIPPSDIDIQSYLSKNGSTNREKAIRDLINQQIQRYQAIRDEQKQREYDAYRLEQDKIEKERLEDIESRLRLDMEVSENDYEFYQSHQIPDTALGYGSD